MPLRVVKQWTAFAVCVMAVIVLLAGCGREGGRNTPGTARGSATSAGWATSTGATSSSDPDQRNRAQTGDASSAGKGALKPLAMAAKLGSYCVERGGRAVLILDVRPRTAVAWYAIYSDGGSGSPPPQGAGYGGYGSGVTRQDGRYEAWWIVGTNAPLGKGHLEVIGRWRDRSGLVRPAFTVADSC